MSKIITAEKSRYLAIIGSFCWYLSSFRVFVSDRNIVPDIARMVLLNWYKLHCLQLFKIDILVVLIALAWLKLKSELHDS